MAANYRYYVMRQHGQGDDGVWSRVIGSEGNRSYALGWFHALTSFLPRPAYALMRYKDSPLNLLKHEWIETSNAAGPPKPAGGKQCPS